MGIADTVFSNGLKSLSWMIIMCMKLTVLIHTDEHNITTILRKSSWASSWKKNYTYNLYRIVNVYYHYMTGWSSDVIVILAMCQYTVSPPDNLHGIIERRQTTIEMIPIKSMRYLLVQAVNCACKTKIASANNLALINTKVLTATILKNNNQI